MKRNNLLMLSFIVLMAVCAIVKSFWDYPMWPTIVAAITMASWVFAFADLFLSQASAISKIADEQLDGADVSLHEVKRIKKAIEIRIEQIGEKAKGKESSSAPSLYTTEDELSHLNSSLKSVSEMESDLQAYTSSLRSGKKHSKTLCRAGCVLTVAGFLSFFVIVIFKAMQEKPVGDTDSLTVWAFCIILLTQYLENWLEEIRLQKTEQMRNCVKGFDALRKSYEDEVMHNQ